MVSRKEKFKVCENRVKEDKKVDPTISIVPLFNLNVKQCSILETTSPRNAVVGCTNAGNTW